MAIYNFSNNRFNKIERTTFGTEGILERHDLQNAIKRQIDIIAPDCLVISEEFSEWSESRRRIDILAVDKKGDVVVIELKRTEKGEHMELQALRYAAMVSTLTFSRAIEIYQKYLKSIDSEYNDAENKLVKFLREDPKEYGFALNTRIILVSGDFSKELTTSVMWLNERNLGIRCVRLVVYKYQEQLFVDVQQIIPLPEAESYLIKIREQLEGREPSEKDYTRYLFQNKELNKRKLVLAVILQWVGDNKPNTYVELLKAFPNETRSGGLFLPAQEAKEKYKKTGYPRHFLGDDEVLEFSDSTKYAVSNQWGKGNIEKFISQSKELGYHIEKVS